MKNIFEEHKTGFENILDNIDGERSLDSLMKEHVSEIDSGQGDFLKVYNLLVEYASREI